MSSVQVAVRVRPFNKRELQLSSELCIKMDGNQTKLLDLEKPQNDKDFTFDYSFWSHDSYIEQPNGYLRPKDEQYADQNYVYDCLGKGILQNAWQGYHCTLFAYGQTGSGKSYSIMGYKPNVGIVPMACKEIFEKIKLDNDSKYEVTFSMMEIYNEKLQDLLIDVNKQQPGGLKIRESSSLGFFAQGLKKVQVKSFDEIERKMDEGSKNRSIAATQMNATSSRAHTIVQIELKQTKETEKKKMQKFSVINLVDLAGSEKTGKTGATGDRLKEASAINKSLSMLGLCISTLADHANGNKSKKIPYRDSVLTKILKNALGGNSKTIMICAISPAQDNYEETLSTLRYANQAKKIKNSARINESATDKIIRELKDENKRLSQQLDELKILLQSRQSVDLGKVQEQLSQIQEFQDANNELINQEEHHEPIKEEEESEIDSESETEEEEEQISYLTNLNEDDQLNFKIKHPLEHPHLIIGKGREKSTVDKIPKLNLKGLGIQKQHCEIFNRDGTLYIHSLCPQNRNYVYLNGEAVEQEQQLFHNDRIILGQNCVYLVKLKDKIQREEQEKIDEEDLDWEYAMEEQNKQLEDIKDQYAKNLKDQFEKEYQEKLRALEQEQKEQGGSKQLNSTQSSGFGNFTSPNQDQEKNKEQLEGDGEEGRTIKKKNTLFDVAKSVFKNRKKELLAQRFLEKARQKKQIRQFQYELSQVQQVVNAMNMAAQNLNTDFSIHVDSQDNKTISVKIVNNNKNLTYFWDKEEALEKYDILLNDIQQIQSDQDQQLELLELIKPKKEPKQISESYIKLQKFLQESDKDPFKIEIYHPENPSLQIGYLDLSSAIQISQDQEQSTFKLNIDQINFNAKKSLQDLQISYTLFDKKHKSNIVKQIENQQNIPFNYEKLHYLSKEELEILDDPLKLALQNVKLELMAVVEEEQELKDQQELQEFTANQQNQDKQDNQDNQDDSVQDSFQHNSLHNKSNSGNNSFFFNNNNRNMTESEDNASDMLVLDLEEELDQNNQNNQNNKSNSMEVEELDDFNAQITNNDDNINNDNTNNINNDNDDNNGTQIQQNFDNNSNNQEENIMVIGMDNQDDFMLEDDDNLESQDQNNNDQFPDIAGQKDTLGLNNFNEEEQQQNQEQEEQQEDNQQNLNGSQISEEQEREQNNSQLQQQQQQQDQLLIISTNQQQPDQEEDQDQNTNNQNNNSTDQSKQIEQEQEQEQEQDQQQINPEQDLKEQLEIQSSKNQSETKQSQKQLLLLEQQDQNQQDQQQPLSDSQSLKTQSQSKRPQTNTTNNRKQQQSIISNPFQSELDMSKDDDDLDQNNQDKKEQEQQNKNQDIQQEKNEQQQQKEINLNPSQQKSQLTQSKLDEQLNNKLKDDLQKDYEQQHKYVQLYNQQKLQEHQKLLLQFQQEEEIDDETDLACNSQKFKIAFYTLALICIILYLNHIAQSSSFLSDFKLNKEHEKNLQMKNYDYQSYPIFIIFSSVLCIFSFMINACIISGARANHFNESYFPGMYKFSNMTLGICFMSHFIISLSFLDNDGEKITNKMKAFQDLDKDQQLECLLKDDEEFCDNVDALKNLIVNSNLTIVLIAIIFYLWVCIQIGYFYNARERQIKRKKQPQQQALLQQQKQQEQQKQQQQKQQQQQLQIQEEETENEQEISSNGDQQDVSQLQHQPTQQQESDLQLQQKQQQQEQQQQQQEQQVKQKQQDEKLSKSQLSQSSNNNNKQRLQIEKAPSQQLFLENNDQAQFQQPQSQNESLMEVNANNINTKVFSIGQQ